MSIEYVKPSGLKHHGEKILETINKNMENLVSNDSLTEILEDYAKTDNLPNEYDDTILLERITNIENSYVSESELSENYLTKSGGAMNENAKISIPSKSLAATIELKDEYLSNSITADGVYIYDSDAKESSWVGANSINAPVINAKNSIKVNGKDVLTSDDKTEITSAISNAKQEVIETVLGENVDADFDTLKEVADWIQSDTTNSAELVTRVSTAEFEIGNLQNSVSDKVDKATGKGLSTNDLTNGLKTSYDTAYTHSQSSHAPTNAEKNIIVGIQKTELI